MGLSISGQGTREGIKNFLKNHPAVTRAPMGTDAAQVAAVQSFLAAEIDAMPAELNGVRIHCESNAHKGGRNISASIVPFSVQV